MHTPKGNSRKSRLPNAVKQIKIINKYEDKIHTQNRAYLGHLLAL